MAGINKVILVGNVGQEVKFKHLENKTAIASFSLATSESYRDKSGNKIENTTWHSIVIWRELAEVANKYVKKGDKLYIEGKLNNRTYDDKEGVKRYITEIIVEKMVMLGNKHNASGTNDSNSTAPSATEVPPHSNPDSPDSNNGGKPNDDLPF